MKRLLVDMSHILKECLWAAKKAENSFFDEESGETVPHADDGYQIFLINLDACLKYLDIRPNQLVLVADGPGGKEMRRRIFPGYCTKREKNAAFLKQFLNLQDMVKETLMLCGAIAVSKDGWEADDLLAAFAAKTDSIIWSGDKDMLAAGDVYYHGQINPDKFMGIDKKYIPVYKALVGDSSDDLPGARGFGEKSFIEMLEKFTDEALEDMYQMLEERSLETSLDPELWKKFQIIIDNAETVYACYDCAKFHHPGYSGFRWEMRYPAGHRDMRKWFSPESTLVTRSNYSQVLDKLEKEILAADFVSFDVEADVCEASREWSKKNMTNSDKVPPIDIIGQEMTGFSINCGRGNEKTYYFSLDHKDTANISKDQALAILNLLPENKPVAIHNVGYELPVVRNNFDLRFDRGWLPPTSTCTLILSGYVDEYEPAGLKYQAKLRMGYDQETYEEVLEKAGAIGMRGVSGEEVLSYGCDDTIVTSQLFSFYQLVMMYEDTWETYHKVDQDAQFLYAESFLNGVPFDMERLAELTRENSEKLAVLEAKIADYLVNLQWETRRELTTEDFFPTVTPQNLSEVMAKKRELEANPEYKITSYTWPGCTFVPVTEITAAEIKRVYQDLTGQQLSTNLRKVDKVIDLVAETEPELAVALSSGVDETNSFMKLNFQPRPELNLGSPKQVGMFLYEALGFPVRLRNKLTDKQREAGQTLGNPATNEDALKHAMIYDCTPEQKDILQTILDGKSCRTENSLFYGPYANYPHWKTGFVHANPGQARQKSGRASSSRPNLSQVSKKSPVREVITVEDGYVFVSFDESAQELRHIANHSGDPGMLSCYKSGTQRDIHSLMGVEVWNLDHDPVTYEEFIKIRKDPTHQLFDAINKARAKAKSAVFLDAYQGTASSLAIQLLITEEEAQAILDAKTKAFPEVRRWQEEMTRVHESKGYAVEPAGRRRHLRLDGSWKDKHELRGALNHLPQGGSGSQIKLILGRVWREKILEKFDAYLCFTVHDECDFAVRKDQVLDFVKTIHPIMTQKYCDFEVEFESSIEIGPNFGKLLELGTTIEDDNITAAADAAEMYKSFQKNHNCKECGYSDCLYFLYSVCKGENTTESCKSNNNHKRQ